MSLRQKEVMSLFSAIVLFAVLLVWWCLGGFLCKIQANFTVYGKINRHKKRDHNPIPLLNFFLFFARGEKVFEK